MEIAEDPEPRAIFYQFMLVSFFGLVLMAGCTTKNKKNDTVPPPQPVVEQKTHQDSFPASVDNGKKKIYLTFDDGPNIGTRVVMKILKDAGVPATFYMIGLHRFGSPDQEQLWKQVNAEPSFEVCNHSFTHAYRNHFPQFYSDVNGAVNDFVRNQDSLQFNNTICRAPGSNVWRLPGLRVDHVFKNRTQVMDSLFKLGYCFTGWDWEWTYNGRTQKARQTPDQLMSELEGVYQSKDIRHKNHLILLAHDLVYADSADASMLRDFIVKLKNNPEYEIKKISEYPGASVAFHKK
jgi:peptidoglycan-N-acetylglucosamine deacetylase